MRLTLCNPVRTVAHARPPVRWIVAAALGALGAVGAAVPAHAQNVQFLDVEIENRDLEQVVPRGNTENQMVRSDSSFTQFAQPQDRLFNNVRRGDDDEAGGEGGGRARVTKTVGIGAGAVVEVSGNNQYMFVPIIYYPFADGGRFLRGLAFNVTLPVVHRITRLNYTIPDETGTPTRFRRQGDAWGIGDLTAGLSWQIRWRNLIVMPSASVKFPTGDADRVDRGVHTPLGSGSWDVMVALNAGLNFRWFRTSFGVAYRYNGPTTYNLNPLTPPVEVSQGANLMANVAVETDFFLENLFIGVGAQYFYTGTSVRNGVDAHTDLMILQVSAPYAYYQITTNLRVEAGLTIPAYIRYDARIVNAPRFEDNLRGTVGVRFLF